MDAERIDEVFTPTDTASPEMFAERVELERRFVGAIQQPGQQIILYGHTGVGKTTLVRNLCAKRGIAMIEVSLGVSLEDTVERAIARVGETEAFEYVSHRQRPTKLGALLALFRVQWGSYRAWDVRRRPVSQRSTDYLTQLMAAHELRVLFVDNFEHSQQLDDRGRLARDIGRMMKEFAGATQPTAPARRPKIVLAGIPQAASELIELRDDVARRSAQIPVDPMTRAELGTILRKGEDSLNIKFDDRCREAIISYSDGFPYHVHRLAKSACLAALDRDPATVRITYQDFAKSIDEIVIADELQLKVRFLGATTGGTEAELRRAIVHAMAAADADEFTYMDIETALSGADYDFSRPVLEDAIRQLVNQRIFARRVDSGGQTRLYRWWNPLMRGFIRMYIFNHTDVSERTRLETISLLARSGQRAVSLFVAGRLVVDVDAGEFWLFYRRPAVVPGRETPQWLDADPQARRYAREIEDALRNACPLRADTWPLLIEYEGAAEREDPQP